MWQHTHVAAYLWKREDRVSSPEYLYRILECLELGRPVRARDWDVQRKPHSPPDQRDAHDGGLRDVLETAWHVAGQHKYVEEGAVIWHVYSRLIRRG